jgi:hypothetical protein
MVDLGSSRFLLGAAQVGGGQKRKSSNKSKSMKSSKYMNSMNSWLGKSKNMDYMKGLKGMKPFFGGDEWKCGQCELVKSVPNPVVVQPVQQTPMQQMPMTMPQTQQVSSASTQSLVNAIMQPVSTTVAIPASMVGGAKQMSIPQYKKYLEALTTERLHKIASGKGVKITKKKDRKTVYVKKATIIKKLCEFKHPGRR